MWRRVTSSVCCRCPARSLVRCTTATVPFSPILMGSWSLCTRGAFHAHITPVTQQLRRTYVTRTQPARQTWARNAMRPWMCPSESCRAVNKATLPACEACGTAKPRLQGWKCVKCKTRNHRGVTACKQCKEPLATSQDFWMCAVCGENNRVDELDDNSRCGYCGYDMAPLALTGERLAEMNEQREAAFQQQEQQERFDAVSAREADEQFGSPIAGAEEQLPAAVRAPVGVKPISHFTPKPPETRHSRIYRRPRAAAPLRNDDVLAAADAVPPGPPGFDWMCRDPKCARINPGDEEACLGCSAHIRPAEWPCPHCGAVNHLSRARCFSCHSGIPVSWVCPACEAATSVYDTACRVCGESRPVVEPRAAQEVWAEARVAQGGGLGGGTQFRPHDWYCTACNGLNFSRRTECYQCGTSRRQGARSAGSGAGGSKSRDGALSYDRQMGDQEQQHSSGRRTAEPNNWLCHQCQASNFRTRRTCWQCGTETTDTLAGREGLENEDNLPHFPHEGFQDAADSKPAEGRMNVWKKTDDWLCAKCFSRNFRGKGECFKCGAPRSLAVAPRRVSVRKPAKL